MQLVAHGGKCCGIKTIHGFGYLAPEYELSSVESRPVPRAFKADYNGSWDYANPGKDFFFDAAPQESGADRLKRLVEYCDKHRPHHVIEVVLADYQMPKWRSTLEENGFKVVTSCLNSNSSTRITIFHRVTDKES